MPASSLHSCLHLGTLAKHPPPPHPPVRSLLLGPRPRRRSRLRDPAALAGTSCRARGVTRGNPKPQRGGGVSGFASGVPSTERHGARPPTAGHSLEKKRRRLKAHPQSLGITKAENYKTKYKGENQHVSVEPSAPRRRSRRCLHRAGVGTFRFLPAAPAPRPALPRCCIGPSQAAPHTL